MAWLDERTRSDGGFHLFSAKELRDGLEFGGERLALVGPQQGIWKPRPLTAALSIRTTYTPAGQAPPYADAEGPDGLMRYAYRGQDPHHADNRALRAAMN